MPGYSALRQDEPGSLLVWTKSTAANSNRHQLIERRRLARQVQVAKQVGFEERVAFLDVRPVASHERDIGMRQNPVAHGNERELKFVSIVT
jgi:hypothetical protein